MPLSPLAVFQPSAAADSSQLQSQTPTNQRNEQTVPAGTPAHAHAPQQAQPHTSTTAAVSVHSIGSISARMKAMACPGACGQPHNPEKMDQAQRKAEITGCTAQVSVPTLGIPCALVAPRRC